MVDTALAFAPLTSVLAFAATLRNLNCTPGAESLHDLHTHDAVVPVYEVTGDSVAEEAASAVRALEDISERLRRLHAAYGEWQEFEPGAYFDLSHAQTRRLVRVSERATTVHVTFYADLLMPSFRAAEHYWYYTFCPAYWKMTGSVDVETDPAEPIRAFAHQVQPAMVAKWTRLCEVVLQARTLLGDHCDYLGAYLSAEERMRWQSAWQRQPALRVDPVLQVDIDAVHTLTLSTEFPLPANRQPGRIRRLRNNRRRRGPGRFLHWRKLDD